MPDTAPPAESPSATQAPERERLLAEVKEMESAKQISERLDRFLAEHGMEKFIHNPVA